MTKRKKLIKDAKKNSSNKETKRKPGRPPKFTPAQIIEAIKRNDGLLVKVATDLGCSYHAIYNCRKKYEEVEEIYQEYKTSYDSSLISEAKRGLMANLKENNLGAICFTLKTKGKNDGWSERFEVTGRDDSPLAEKIRQVQNMTKEEMDEDIRQLEKDLNITIIKPKYGKNNRPIQ